MNLFDSIGSGYEEIFIAAFETRSTKVVEGKVLDLEIGSHGAVEDDDAFLDSVEKIRHKQ